MSLCGPVFTRSMTYNFQTVTGHTVVYKNTIRDVAMPKVILQRNDKLL